MTEFNNWMLANWFELGILAVLCAILGTCIWFARNVLRTLRASQEQMGALLKLSLSDAVPAQAALAETPILSMPEQVKRGPNLLVVVCRKLVNWFQAPMGSGEHETWHKIVHWLQAPAKS